LVGLRFRCGCNDVTVWSAFAASDMPFFLFYFCVARVDSLLTAKTNLLASAFLISAADGQAFTGLRFHSISSGEKLFCLGVMLNVLSGAVTLQHFRYECHILCALGLS
jgi:hypothetical protein